MAEPNFIEALNQKIAGDPNLQQSMIQFGANISKPYDIRTANPASQAMGALQGSIEYLNALRANDVAAKQRERTVQVSEGQLGVAQRGADTAQFRADTEKKSAVEGEIPYKQAYAEYLRNKTGIERLKAQMEKLHGRTDVPFDKNEFEAASAFADNAARPGTAEHRRMLLDALNNFARVRGRPTTPYLLQDIPDELIAGADMTPEVEQMFLKHYGPAAGSRLRAVREKQAAEAAKAAKASGKVAPTVKTAPNGKVTVPFGVKQFEYNSPYEGEE